MRVHVAWLSIRCVFWQTVKRDSGNIPIQVRASDVVNRVKETDNKHRRDGADNALLKKPGSEYPNCGASQSCADDEFSVHIYTGTRNKDAPKICVDGS